MDWLKSFWSYFLRFGPLVAAALLALTAAPFIGGNIAGTLQSVVGVLSFLGIQPDQSAVAAFGEAVSAVVILLGVARKLISIWAKYQAVKAR